MTERAANKSSLHGRIMWAMIIGVALGLLARWVAGQSETAESYVRFAAEKIATPIGKIFIRMIIMVVVPLVISALILGVVEIGDPRKLGRIGLRTLGLTALFSLSAVLIGVTMTNIIKPGVGLDQAEQKKLQAQFADKAAEAVRNAETAAQKTIETRLIDMLPNNLMAEVVGAADGSSPGNGMLAVMVFSLIFGIAVASAGQKAETLVRCLEGVFAAAMHVIGFAMKIAPLAVACLLFSVTVTLGAGFLVMLGKFVATVLAGLAIHAFVVYPAALLIFARRSPWAFFRDSQEAALTAFATSSSNATLPVSLRVAEEDLKINPKVAKFVLTVGATGNQNGTALFEGVVVLFLAQVFGKDLGLEQQFTVVLMAVMAGIGTAGVPGGSMPLIVGILRTIDVNGLSIALVQGVDRLLDMARTAVNVVGDLVIATCVGDIEDEEEMEAPSTGDAQI
jgi:dicarboxylate/amino acid:cation (Na+ or H+) symporter, DAACS family